jgi:hypothetical protein
MNVYRYVSEAERHFIEANSFVQSFWEITWFAVDPPSLYLRNHDAVEHLALSSDRQWRFGPIPADEAPTWDVAPPRTVVPQQTPEGRWVMGGGTECATSETLWLQGFHRLL